MKKNLLLFFLLALLLSATTSANEYEFEVDGIYYTRLFGEIPSDTEVKVTYDSSSYGPSYSGDITIPANVTYEGATYSVTAIDDGAFSWCPGLTSVYISSSVRYIGDYAFSWCTALTNIVIPSSVKYIGNGAFENTKWFNDQPDGLVYAGLIAYKYKGNMPTGTSLALSEGTLGIAENAFYGCEGLASIVIPNSVTTIGDYSFSWCTALTSVSIGNSVQYIGDEAFAYSRLTSIDIPNSATSIGNNAFYCCESLTSVSIGKSVWSIGDDVFYGCRNLLSITVASGNSNYDSRDNCNAIIRTTSNKLMTGCLTTTIPNSVTSIGRGAFVSGSGMTILVIPGSVNTIGGYSFVECSDLEIVKCLGSVPPRMTGADIFSEDTYNNATLVVPRGSEEAYAATDDWWLFNNIEGWDVTSPGDVNGDGLMNITDVTVLIDYLLTGNSSGVSIIGADVDGNGQVNIADVTALIDMLLSGN